MVVQIHAGLAVTSEIAVAIIKTIAVDVEVVVTPVVLVTLIQERTL